VAGLDQQFLLVRRTPRAAIDNGKASKTNNPAAIALFEFNSS
jgi:hypothetical protein